MNYFDMIAKEWENDERVLRSKIIVQHINREIGYKHKSSLLDYGCGTGLVSIGLSNKMKSITCVDSSNAMLSKLEENLKNYDIKNIKIINTSDFEKTEKELYDIIICSMIIHHISDVVTFLKNIKNRLKKNGRLIVVELDEEDGTFHSNDASFNGHNGFNQPDFVAKCKNAGFNYVSVETIHNFTKKINGIEREYSIFLSVSRT